jgi:3-methyl-2-oxobutanoate hydroxymethyltransferase
VGKKTVPAFRSAKRKGEKLAVLTAYDFPSAQLVDASGVDAILVGDSCATTLLGRKNTLSITMDEMLHHVKVVSAAVQNALVIADLPFMSYQVSPEEAVRNAGRMVTEGDAQAVKLEGPPAIFAPTIRAILNASIPVMGHLGLTPQSIHQLGGYKVQGRDATSRKKILEAAKGLDELGCFGIVLECVTADLAAEVTAAVSCPTIGIGAGAGCDGQVLVMHDILGWGFTTFTKTYSDVKGQMSDAFKAYVEDVKSGAFPAKEHAFQ